MDELLAVIGTQRTGSTAVTRHLESHDRVVSYGEVFNRTDRIYADRHPGLRQHLRDRLGQEPASDGQPGMADIRRADPVATLSALREFTGAQGRAVSVLKIFDRQLKPQQTASALAAQGAKCLILLRRPIDSFISLKKAKRINSWGTTDTTDLRVRLKASEYTQYFERKSHFYREVAAALEARGVACRLLRYEDIFAPDTDPRGVLRAACEELGVDLGAPEDLPEWRRQDRATDPADKVANWSSFRAALTIRGGGRLLDSYFL